MAGRMSVLLALGLLVIVLPAGRSEQQGSGKQGGRPKLTQISVIGERHSGTNYMRSLMAENFKNSVKVDEYYCQFKHYYQSWNKKTCPPLNRTLVIVMLRNPLDWAIGMHKKCWCGEGDDNLSDLKFKDFMTSSMKEFNNRPWTNQNPGRCKHVMECRTQKYLNFLNMTRWVPHGLIKFVRHEDVMDPYRAKAFVSKLAKQYNLETNEDEAEHVQKYKGYEDHNFNPWKVKSESLWFSYAKQRVDPEVAAKIDLILKQANTAVESMAGYNIAALRQQDLHTH
ncbi:hypothetical protein FOA52_011794 [Chlamydomonas sp. UWO 241]|nr:hypothetical protein FOA52_011794 [Chlamydomonas sp. UWO 241]